MANPFSILQTIAEQKIVEAMENGVFDNLPGQGQPLELENLDNVPEDMRMAYKILKNAGCIPPELADRKEASNIIELLENCPDEQEKIRNMRKLRLILERIGRTRRHMLLESGDQYYDKILRRLEKHERNLSS